MQAAKDTLENEFERKDVTPGREEQAAVLEEKYLPTIKKLLSKKTILNKPNQLKRRFNENG